MVVAAAVSLVAKAINNMVETSVIKNLKYIQYALIDIENMALIKQERN